MLSIVQWNIASNITYGIAEKALRLPAQTRIDFIEIALGKELRAARSVAKRIVWLEDKAYRLMEGFVEDLGAKDANGAAVEIDRLLGGAPRVLDLAELLSELEFGTAHELLQALTAADDLQVLANRYGEACRDRVLAESTCDQLHSIRKSLEIYRAGGWLQVGNRIRRFDVETARGELEAAFPQFGWQRSATHFL